MKKIVKTALVLVSVLMLGIITIQAAIVPDEMVQPMWDNIIIVESSLVFDGTVGCAYGCAGRQSDTDSIEGIMTVYKIVDGRWIYVASDEQNTSENYTIGFEFYFTGEVGYEYVLVFEVYAYSPAGGEDHTKYCYETCTGE